MPDRDAADSRARERLQNRKHSVGSNAKRSASRSPETSRPTVHKKPTVESDRRNSSVPALSKPGLRRSSSHDPVREMVTKDAQAGSKHTGGGSLDPVRLAEGREQIQKLDRHNSTGSSPAPLRTQHDRTEPTKIKSRSNSVADIPAASLTSSEDLKLAQSSDLALVLNDCSTLTARLAALHMSCQQAEARFDQANSEYIAQTQHFSHYPPIKRLKSDAKDKAKKDYEDACKRRDDLAKQHNAKLAHLADKITKLRRADDHKTKTVSEDEGIQIIARLQKLEEECDKLRLQADEWDRKKAADSNEYQERLTARFNNLQEMFQTVNSRVNDQILKSQPDSESGKIQADKLRDITTRLATLEEKYDASGSESVKLDKAMQVMKSQLMQLGEKNYVEKEHVNQVEASVARTKSETERKIDYLQENFASLQQKLSEMQQSAAHRAERDHALDTDLAHHIRDLESKYEAMQKDVKRHQSEGALDRATLRTSQTSGSSITPAVTIYAEKGELETVKSAVRGLTQKMIGLQSPQLVAAMCNQLQQTCPDVWGLQAAIDGMRGSILAMDTRIPEIQQQTQLTAQRQANEGSATQLELQALRSDVQGLQERLNEYILKVDHQMKVAQEDIRTVHKLAIVASHTAEDALMRP